MRPLALLALALSPVGCAGELFNSASSCPPVDVPGAFYLAATRPWAATEVQVRPGDIVRLEATGTIRAQNGDEIGPEGTYLYDDAVVAQPFPIPSTADGPAPCFGLLARIGDDGPPLPVGARRTWIADRAGIVQLGVNDFDHSDNAGGWHVRIERTDRPEPIAYEQIVDATAPEGRPIPGASVVVFYVDGLRPDVVREMVALGHLPNIRRLFVDGGARFEHAYTAFPSDTITSNGTMWTGVFSDRHGLKGQVRFSRRTLHSDSYLEPLGPNRSAQLLGPTGLDRFLHDTSVASVRVLAGDAAAVQYDKARTSRAKPIYERLTDDRDATWATGILPVMTETPPLLWTKSMARYLPYLRATEAWQYVDDANAHFARRHLLGRDAPVTVVWLPETDSVSHKRSRGQFGLTRRTIARADLLIGDIVAELEDRGRFDSTYLVLCSDHGHHGGQSSHLAHYDLANELLFAPREVDDRGRWTGGGLGLSVRQHRFWNRHAGDESRSFAFVDGESDGAARIFLPRNGYTSADWSAPSDPAALIAYPVAPNRPPIDLVATIANARSTNGNGESERPVDLVMFRLADNAIVVTNADRGTAVIDRLRAPNGEWILRYRVVENLRPHDDGGLDFDVVAHPHRDPLRLLESFDPTDVLGVHHDERTWLRLTAGTTYPDAVVTLTRHLLWDGVIAERRREFAPDLVVTATPGWYFGRASSPGTMHGYPFADAMRASLFVSGPNIRAGARITDPARLVDLTPTLLDMAGVHVDPLVEHGEFDGRPLRTIYEPDRPDHFAVTDPVYWSDVDLHAWQGLSARPLAPYEHLPVEVNQPTHPLDLNNIAYALLTISDLNILRLLDDALSPINGGTRPTTKVVERTEGKLRTRGGWTGEGVEAINAGEPTIGDYTWTSMGNLKRADGVVNWLQGRTLEADRRMAEPIGRDQLPGTELLHAGIDGLQEGVWETYRFTQRLVAQIVDETVLNGIEDGATRGLNTFHRVPAEVRATPRTIRAQSPAPTPRGGSEPGADVATIGRTDRGSPVAVATGLPSNDDDAPTAVEHPLSNEERAKLKTRFEREVAAATKRIEADPTEVAAYSGRGDALFFLGRFDESLRDYEKMVELNPRLGDSHWRRGIARFYAAKFKEAAKQFEDYHTFDDVDRENGIWRFLSQHRAHGRKQAREGLLKYEKTDREPFPDVYKLFAGDIEPEAILARITKADLTANERESRRFYAHLYIGLNHAVEGRDEAALEHLRAATANTWGPNGGFGPTWMWHVGRVHHDVLRKKLADKRERERAGEKS